MSIGVSRLMAFILGEESGIRATRGTPSAVVVAVTEESRRGEADAVAMALRARDIPCDVSPSAAKFGKQIRYAERRDIHFVWLTAGGAGTEVKAIAAASRHRPTRPGGPRTPTTSGPACTGPDSEATIIVQALTHQYQQGALGAAKPRSRKPASRERRRNRHPRRVGRSSSRSRRCGLHRSA